MTFDSFPISGIPSQPEAEPHAEIKTGINNSTGFAEVLGSATVHVMESAEVGASDDLALGINFPPQGRVIIQWNRYFHFANNCLGSRNDLNSRQFPDGS